MFVREDFRGGAMVAKLSEANLLKKPDCVFVGLVVRIIDFTKKHLLSIEMITENNRIVPVCLSRI